MKELGPLNSNTTKIGVIHNDAVPTLGLTNPNGQVDLRRAWLDTERDTSTSHDWLYFAWERDNNSGSGFIAYEFMQNPRTGRLCLRHGDRGRAHRRTATRGPTAQAGDFMILWDQQGGSLDLYLRTWSGTAPNLTLGAPTLLNAAVSQAAYSADGFRGEAAVDLTATIFGGIHRVPVVRQHHPQHGDRQLQHRRLQGHHPQDRPAHLQLQSTTVTTPKTGAGADIPAGGLSIGTGVVAVKDSAVVSLDRRHCHTGGFGRVLPVQGRLARPVRPPVARRSARRT